MGTKRENLSPLTDFNINFADRQTLKILEDSVIDLQVILASMLKTITRIREHCRKCCAKVDLTAEEADNLQVILEEFDEYIKEAEIYVERGKALDEKAHSTAQLVSFPYQNICDSIANRPKLSDLLSYEEAVALKDLTSETQQESKAMMYMTERSTKDAAAVKILTIITLVYLPTTIVFVSDFSPWLEKGSNHHRTFSLRSSCNPATEGT